jgi:hypothetical protein
MDTEINPEHHWAVYAADGEVLTTCVRPGEGTYWAYKAKLDGTEVGPWPDRDRPMLPLDEPCPRCEGSGTQPGSTVVAIDEDRNPVEIPDNVDRTEDFTFETCFSCCGLKYTKGGRYGGEYKNEAGLKSGLARGTARKCRRCQGVGELMRLALNEECYHCKGLGMKPRWDPTRPVLPPQVSDCDDATDAFMDAWLRTITITVVRNSRSMTWGEAHLGFAGLGSVVDYGHTWSIEDDTEIIQRALESSHFRGTQFIKMINRETRTFGPALIIDVTKQGYTLLVANTPVAHGLGGLPPTYFPRVFEEA